MIIKFYIIFILSLSFCVTAESQIKQPLQRKKDAPKGSHFIGMTAGVNQISGLTWEFQLKNNKGQLSGSTLSLIGGYSSRYPKYDVLTRIDTNIFISKKREWTHGLGFTAMINNYFSKSLNELYFSIGIGGHYFIRKEQRLKTANVLAFVGYKKALGEQWYLQAQTGACIMGSNLKSSSGSDINGFYFAFQSAVYYRLK